MVQIIIISPRFAEKYKKSRGPLYLDNRGFR